MVEGKEAVETQLIEAKIWTAVLLLALMCFVSGQALLFQSSVSQPQHEASELHPPTTCGVISTDIRQTAPQPAALTPRQWYGAVGTEGKPPGQFRCQLFVQTPGLKESQASFQP